jgi:hypothetical protein
MEKLKEKIDDFKFYNISAYPDICKFRDKIKNTMDMEEICIEWKKTFRKIMKKAYGFNRKSSNAMFEWVGYNHNWEKLWYDDSVSWESDRESFYYDLGYISDRLSMDRILRVHYMFGSALYKSRESGKKEVSE